jgi:hypothetical protein
MQRARRGRLIPPTQIDIVVELSVAAVRGSPVTVPGSGLDDVVVTVFANLTRTMASQNAVTVAAGSVVNCQTHGIKVAAALRESRRNSPIQHDKDSHHVLKLHIGRAQHTVLHRNLRFVKLQVDGSLLWSEGRWSYLPPSGSNSR